jgi:hypothetical protein
MDFSVEQLQEQDIIHLRDISDEFSDINPEEVKPFLIWLQSSVGVIIVTEKSKLLHYAQI